MVQRSIVSIGIPKMEHGYLGDLDRNKDFKVDTCALMSIIYVTNVNIIRCEM